MLDLVYLAGTMIFFALLAGYVYGCKHLEDVK